MRSSQFPMSLFQRKEVDYLISLMSQKKKKKNKNKKKKKANSTVVNP
jgi:hypothetical protein